MPESLLATKFYRPPPRTEIVQRPRLLEKLLQGVQRPGSFTLLSGPAGSGKTTLLSQFVAQLGQPVAWLSLDEGDNDPVRFWTYLITACQAVLDGIGESALALFNTADPLPDYTIPTLLINDLTGRGRAIVLVLDDYHLIQNPAVQAGLVFLLDHLPDTLHLVVSSRADPPWPLARYRVRNRLNEIRTGDLRFNREETADFLNRAMGLNLATEEVTALAARTEGWAAGLHLAALSMQGRADISAFVQGFTGSHVYVAEYLVEEILKQQPQEVQQFLLQTSILDRLSAGLCDAVTGGQDGQAVLNSLHRANLFVIPLDDDGRWFRYHHLFADLLRARLPQALPAEAIAARHQRAGRWYEDRGFVMEAIHHFSAAQEFERVAVLVEQEARRLMFAGQARTLRSWLDLLPEVSFQTHPRLVIYRVWLELMQGEADLSPQALQEKEQVLRALPSSPENDRLRLELMVVLSRFVAFSGDTARAARLAEEAMARLPEDELALRARAQSTLAVACWMEGQAEIAGRAYHECLRLAQAAGNYSLAAHATMMRALEQTDYGRLREAARAYQSIIDLGVHSGQPVFYPAGQGYIGLAGIYLEWNDLETAEGYLKQGLELCRRGGLPGLSTAYALQARLRQARGDLEGALAAVGLVSQPLHGVDPAGPVRQIRLRLALGDLAEAARFAAPWLELLKGEPTALQPPLLLLEIIKLAVARVFLARGEVERAVPLLAEVQATAEPDRRCGRLIELYLLRALACQQQPQAEIAPEAVDWLEQALELAEPEGYALLFLEEGAALMPLLTAVIKRQATPARLKQYAQKLLAAFPGCGQPAAPPAADKMAGLVEPLTPREMEVLRLIAAGDANQTIAEKLVITTRTVKKHTGNIYGKLNVSSRTQAVARARQLGLLPPDA